MAEYTLEQLYSGLRAARDAGDDGAAAVLQSEIHSATRGLAGDPTEGMGIGEKALAGVGYGMANVGRNVEDIASSIPGLGGLRRSPEDWREFHEAGAQLGKTIPGKVGTIAGETASMLPSMLVSGGALNAARAGPALQTIAQGAAQGAVLAGPGERAEGAAVGGALGGGIYGGGKALGALGKAALRGVVKPSAAAQALQREGVEGLTIGQMAPDSILAQLEEASTSTPFVGPLMQAQRQAAKESWQNAVLNKARAPGAPMSQGGSVQEKLADVYQGFEGAYAPVKAAPVQPVIKGQQAQMPLTEALEHSVNDPNALASDDTRRMVGKFLQNQTTLLTPPALEGVGPGQLTAETLLKMRSNIRGAAREALQRQDFAAAQLLGNAERAVSMGLESQLPSQLASALKATDRQYGKQKIVSEAVRSAGDSPSGFTPSQLGMALRRATEKGSYARGDGGELRDLASAGREVFDSRIPPTGARLLSMPVAMAASPAFATQTGRNLLTGQTAAQRKAQALIDALRRRVAPETADSIQRSEALSAALLAGRATRGE